MSVRSFHSLFMVTVVAGAALGCYLVSLRVASERAALDQVQRQIVHTQYDIRLLQTEIGTRARLAQLERWNVRVLALSAPSADQILGDRFQLARLVAPQSKPAIEAPVILATAPAPVPAQVTGQPPAESPVAETRAAPTAEILHQASLRIAPSQSGPARDAGQTTPAATRPAATSAPQPKPEGAAVRAASTKIAEARAVPPKPPGDSKKAGEKTVRTATSAVTRPGRAANIDPLAPLAEGETSLEGSRTDR
jgi:hypothetical protein